MYKYSLNYQKANKFVFSKNIINFSYFLDSGYTYVYWIAGYPNKYIYFMPDEQVNIRENYPFILEIFKKSNKTTVDFLILGPRYILWFSTILTYNL